MKVSSYIAHVSFSIFLKDYSKSLVTVSDPISRSLTYIYLKGLKCPDIFSITFSPTK